MSNTTDSYHTTTSNEKLLDYLPFIILVLLWIFILVKFSSLPDTIPTHFNFKGEVDGYGNKSSILFVPALASILIVLLSVLSRYPQYYNYAVKITPENKAFQYRNGINMIQTLKLSLSIVFSILTFIIYKNVNNQFEEGNRWLLPIIILSVLLPVIYFIYKSYTYK